MLWTCWWVAVPTAADGSCWRCRADCGLVFATAVAHLQRLFIHITRPRPQQRLIQGHRLAHSTCISSSSHAMTTPADWLCGIALGSPKQTLLRCALCGSPLLPAAVQPSICAHTRRRGGEGWYRACLGWWALGAQSHRQAPAAGAQVVCWGLHSDKHGSGCVA